MERQQTAINDRPALSLLELNSLIRGTLARAFPESYWVRAEMSDVRVNASSGHCYLEFIEKEPRTGRMVAKTRGAIWASTFRTLRPYFEKETGQLFTSGLKVLVRVSVEFHELYGMSLTVVDIDPSYTMGDMARRRQEILRQLQAEGVLTLNKELEMPTLPRRVAIITSPTAAGYEDFLSQLRRNAGGYVFYTRLFPALMQGERTEESVIAALDRIYRHRELFDVVVIIRGGGATSDLNSFDSYPLAANCAQFPLPIITGIGHERDDTVVDIVAHTRVKTPTAAAEFLIGRMDEAAGELDDLRQRLINRATERLAQARYRLGTLTQSLPALVNSRVERANAALRTLAARLPATATALLTRQQADIDHLALRLRNGATKRIGDEERFLQFKEQFTRMASPEYILRRGYSLTLRDGKIVKRAAELREGERLTTRFADGETESILEIIHLKSEE